MEVFQSVLSLCSWWNNGIPQHIDYMKSYFIEWIMSSSYFMEIHVISQRIICETNKNSEITIFPWYTSVGCSILLCGFYHNDNSGMHYTVLYRSISAHLTKFNGDYQDFILTLVVINVIYKYLKHCESRALDSLKFERSGCNYACLYILFKAVSVSDIIFLVKLPRNNPEEYGMYDMMPPKIIIYSDQNAHIIWAILHCKQTYVLSITSDMNLSKIIIYPDRNENIIWAILHYKQAYVLSITTDQAIKNHNILWSKWAYHMGHTALQASICS